MTEMNLEGSQQYLDTMDRIAYLMRVIGAQFDALIIPIRELQVAFRQLEELLSASVVESKGTLSE